MVVLRVVGVLLLSICAFWSAFLLAYAGILVGWIVYADYSGALGGADGSARTVALFWAPLGAFIAGLLSAGSFARIGLRRAAAWKGKATPSGVAETPADDTQPDIERRFSEHSALLQELQSLTLKSRVADATAQGELDDPFHQERRVA